MNSHFLSMTDKHINLYDSLNYIKAMQIKVLNYVSV